MKLTLNPAYQLYEHDGQAYCDSLHVAESFDKRHDNVLADIKNLDCSEQFNLLNFQEISYRDECNRKQPKCIMTKDGFTFLVMGYRRKKAAAFNRLQEERRDIEEVLYDAVSRKVQIKLYLDALKQQDGILEEFDDALWRAVVEGCTVGTGKITFTLKDGTAVEWEI